MININLLPPELKFQRISAKRNASLITLCLVVVFIVAILGIIGRSLQSTVEAYLANTKNSVEKDSSQLDQDQDLQDLALLVNDRWQTTEQLEKDHIYWSQVIQELNNSTPSDVQFENIIINAEKTPNFILQGNTTTEREIIKFKDKLEESPFFKTVSFKSSSLSLPTADQEQKEKLKFTLEFDLEQKKAQ